MGLFRGIVGKLGIHRARWGWRPRDVLGPALRWVRELNFFDVSAFFVVFLAGCAEPRLPVYSRDSVMIRYALLIVPLLVASSAFAQMHAHSCGVDCSQRAPITADVQRPLDRAAMVSATHQRGGGASLEDGSLIDILVLYTPQATTFAGGQAEIESLIMDGLDELNTATMDSGIPTVFRIVHAQEVAFAQSGSMGTQLTRLRTPGDGVLDEAHDLRDLHKADLVMLVISAGDVCGIANIGVGPGNTPTPQFGFSVVAATCMTGPASAFAHEIGHNMGMLHGYEENPCTNGATRFAKGYMAPDESFQTLMGVGSAPRVVRFSNPGVDLNGQPTGVAIGDRSAADSASAFALAAPVVANYRSRDMNNNGILDDDEIVSGDLNDCNGNGYPDFADQDFNRNGVPDECDIAMGTSTDSDLDGIPDDAELSIIRVDPAAIGTGLGDTWSNARTDLQDALELARASGDIEQIWLKHGTYLPSDQGHRARFFDIPGGVALMGGFDGTEAVAGDRSPSTAQTILSGDQFQDDDGLLNREDNALHVVYIHDEPASVVLDHLVIEHGNGDSEVNCGALMEFAGGVLVYNTDTTITNCVIRENTALNSAGMILIDDSKTDVRNNHIYGNTAIDGTFYGVGGGFEYRGWIGGVRINTDHNGADNVFVSNLIELNQDTDSVSGVSIVGCAPYFVNNVIARNTSLSSVSGAGLSAVLCDGFEVINCTIAGNLAPNNMLGQRAGGFTSNRSQVSVINSILWGNHPHLNAGDETAQFSESGVGVEHEFVNSIVEGWTGTYNGSGIDADPVFVDAPGGDFALSAPSPAIDASDTTRIPADTPDFDSDLDLIEPLPLDFLGNPRSVDDPDTIDTGSGAAPIADIGAIEFQPESVVCIADLTGDGQLDFFDVSAFLTAYQGGDAQADLNDDGLFNFFDVSVFLSAYGAGCP